MKKKGFTLIEIIICIGVLVVIGTASFFGIRLISKNIRISKLNQITDEVISAAQVYLETNEESYNQLYKEQNGVVIPIVTLVNEGLLSLENTELTVNDLKGEYVVTALTDPEPGTTEGCVDIRSVTSWTESMSQPLYICTKSDGSSNLTIISPKDTNNYIKVQQETYFFKGADPNNYLIYKKDGNEYSYRILSVDTDDSIAVAASRFSDSSKFYSIFKIEEAYNLGSSSDQEKVYPQSGSACSDGYLIDTSLIGTTVVTRGGHVLSEGQYSKTFDCEAAGRRTWIVYKQDFYLKLKSCMKITSGIGTKENPYILKNEC